MLFRSLAAQAVAQRGQQRVVSDIGKVIDLQPMRLTLAARGTAADHRHAGRAAPGRQHGLGLDLVAGVDQHIHRLGQQRRPVGGLDEFLDLQHPAARVDVGDALGQGLDLGLAHRGTQRLDLAVDVGQVIDLDGVINQTEGGALQSMSWTLKESVQFDRTRVLTRSWGDYPVLRFSELPEVKVHVIDRPDQPALGAGEGAQGPVAAALGNALFDALGVRVRHLPLSQDHILRAMHEQ